MLDPPRRDGSTEAAAAQRVLATPSSDAASTPRARPSASSLPGIPEPRFSGSSFDTGRLALDDEPTRREARAYTLPPLLDRQTLFIAIVAAVMATAAAALIAFGSRLL